MERWLNVLFGIFAIGWVVALIATVIWYVTNAPTPVSAP
jgi:hypothetical protein